MRDETRRTRDETQRLRGETEAVWATAASFVVGAVGGAAVLGGEPRPLTGEHGLAVPIAAMAAAVTASAFIVSTLRHRRGETAPMPRWQATVSVVSSIALTLAFAAVAAMGVLLAAEVLSGGLQGLRLATVGGGMLAGVASAVGGRFAYGAGIGLRTSDIAGILFGYLVIGTLFAMATAADPRWWQHNFSTLGGGGGWAFNGTLVVAGLLVATVGSYIGRDLHRMLGDEALTRISRVVALWAVTGVALAAVGLLPLDRLPVPHDIAAVATLALFTVAAVVTALAFPQRPRALTITTIGVVALVIMAVVLCVGPRLYGVTALEAMVVGLGLLWMTTLVRVLAILAPEASRPSARATLRLR
ncbi:DUF998 domain-containing protein [Microbacterium sp. XT11]|uniref:DUF998 domain-containing protein n=1 Tax=Microbacterium sp. XT11 TaxID=367477 RepID=UPI000AB40EC2|nr:DUF998 domain-containing protein [Microbacterium sp. XT11]